jgi:hypothetical protein
MRTLFFLLATTVLASPGWAEPTFLAKQYTRCTACHYSPTGGGLLTPYGRFLSHRELSTTGGSDIVPSGAEDDPRGEQAFLYGALGKALGPVQLGLEMRPSHLRIGFPGGHQGLNLLMNLDLTAALETTNGWTAFGTVGREPPNAGVRNGRTLPDSAFISYEHWISYQTDSGLRIRAGRFLPAYGVRFPDHTTYTRRYLDLDRNDQVYGVEVSATKGLSLVQVMVSPGKAEAILHDGTHRGFSTSGRWQVDLAPRATLVGSGFYRHSTDADPQSGAVGGALGIAPTSRVSMWTEVDANLQTKAGGGHSWVVAHETSVEVYRGIWLKVSPQFLTSGGAPGASNRRRLAFSADLLPRTHWNVNVGYYLDHASGVGTSTLVTQLHLFL